MSLSPTKTNWNDIRATINSWGIMIRCFTMRWDRPYKGTHNTKGWNWVTLYHLLRKLWNNLKYVKNIMILTIWLLTKDCNTWLSPFRINMDLFRSPCLGSKVGNFISPISVSFQSVTPDSIGMIKLTQNSLMKTLSCS